MRFALVGGDTRSALLARLFLRDGHRVQTWALERAALPAEIPRAGSLTACVYGADAVVLPVPAERGGLLNAPLSAQAPAMEELIGALWPEQLLLGGGFSPESARAALREKLRLEDLLRRPDFVTANAALTAECALGLLLRESARALRDENVLVLGYGRIGRLLAQKLLALGAQVTAAARSPWDRAFAAAAGCRALDYGELEGVIGEMGVVVNTVPARVLSSAALCCLEDGALLVELASPPGGFDPVLAGNLGLRVLPAPGLPGKFAPEAAAALMRDAVYAALEEQEE